MALKFETTTGTPLLIHGRMRDGSQLPFGAQVVDGRDNEVGIVGQAGQVFVRRANDEAPTLRVILSEDSRCVLDLPPDAAGTGEERIRTLDAVCREEATPLAGIR
ncbi:FimD/PapC C-terminal domain-containing protein [Lysobacter soli]|uniref:FimD/PapC C-terminal domain-containing protein n=1 Tax=Lysobacter soli TaxID=453783 RepID=UPI0037C98E24